MDILTTLVRMALAEDVGPGDWTTLWTVPAEERGRARIIAKEDLVVAGTDAVVAVFLETGRRAAEGGVGGNPEKGVEGGRAGAQGIGSVMVEVVLEDGALAERGATILRLEGPMRHLLTGERTALNFLARLSGIATLTRAFVQAVDGTGTRIVDTRKTTPGWRLLEKAAVRSGGGTNHRMGLHDMVMIKDNHVAAAGGIGPAIERVHRANERTLPVEVEVTDLRELQEALDHLDLGVTRILLDNMSPGGLRACVKRIRSLPSARRPEVEASGNVTLQTVRAVAESGVDLVSVGALTHSAPAADLSMRMEGGAE